MEGGYRLPFLVFSTGGCEDRLNIKYQATDTCPYPNLICVFNVVTDPLCCVQLPYRPGNDWCVVTAWWDVNELTRGEGWCHPLPRTGGPGIIWTIIIATHRENNPL